MSVAIPDRLGVPGRLVPVITLVVMALALGGTVIRLALEPGTSSSQLIGGFDSSIHDGTTEVFTVSGVNPQVSDSGRYVFTQESQDSTGTSSTGTPVTTTLYNLPEDLTSSQPTQVWSGTCTHAGFWGDSLLCDSTLVATDGSTASFPEGENRSVLASTHDVVVLGKTTDESAEGLTTVEIEGVGTDGSVVWTAEDPYLGNAITVQAGRRSWASSQYMSGVTRSTATHHPSQSQLIDVATGTVLQTADATTTLYYTLSDGYYVFPFTVDSGEMTIRSWDGTVLHTGTYHASTSRPDGDDSTNFASPPVTTDEFALIDTASSGLTDPVVVHDGVATVYEGVTSSTSMACESLTTDGSTIDTSSMSDGSTCSLTLREAGPRSILVSSTEHGSALWNLDDGGSWWTSDVSDLKAARDGLLVGTRDGSTVGMVPVA